MSKCKINVDLLATIKNALKAHDKTANTCLLEWLYDIKINGTNLLLFVNVPVVWSERLPEVEANYRQAIGPWLESEEISAAIHVIASIASIKPEEVGESPGVSGDPSPGPNQNGERAAESPPSPPDASLLAKQRSPGDNLGGQKTRTAVPEEVPGVRHLVMVVSGKGGVGKSTVAVQLARFLVELGHRVGMVDADVHGPSLGRMLDIAEEPVIKDNLFIPPIRHGIKLMSSSLFAKRDEALIWRGPMASKLVHQILYSSDWQWSSFLKQRKPSDFVIVDTPPGTGDVALSLMKYAVAGAVVVSTAQAVAIDSMHKSTLMLKKMGIPIIGVVENMSALYDEVSGTMSHPMGCGTVRGYAQGENISFLGELPLVPALWQGLDQGKISLPEKQSSSAALFNRQMAEIAATVAQFCSQNPKNE